MSKKTICELCRERESKDKILDYWCENYIHVCSDCYNNTFLEVVQEGIDYFIDWASCMFGSEKAIELSRIIFGEEIDEQETMLMFTYGILKYPQNIEREGGFNIVENCTISGHKMYLYNHSFPITRKSGNSNDLVYGTLFEIPKRVVLNDYDYIEGYNPKRPYEQNMYNREIVDVTKPNGEVVEAEMYYANPLVFEGWYGERNLIPSGNFDDRYIFSPMSSDSNKKKKKNKKKNKKNN